MTEPLLTHATFLNSVRQVPLVQSMNYQWQLPVVHPVSFEALAPGLTISALAHVCSGTAPFHRSGA